jgi:hypothetical protein
MFHIGIDPCTGLLGRGTVCLGDFREQFEVILEYWSRDDYVRHWDAALRQLLEGAATSALITSMSDPSSATFLFWWPAYREGDSIVFQHQALFLEELDRPFLPEEFADHIPERTATSTDGDRVSEWRVSLSDIAEFLASR